MRFTTLHDAQVRAARAMARDFFQDPSFKLAAESLTMLHVYSDDCGCDFCVGVRIERAEPAVKRVREVVAPVAKPDAKPDAFRPAREMGPGDWRKYWAANAPKSELERALISGVEEVQRFGAMPDMAIIGGAVYRKPKMKRRP